MYLAFEQLVGGEVAATMMEHLHPVGWADVSTKHDVEREVALLREEMRAGVADLRAEIARSAQRQIMWSVSLMVPGFVALFAAIIAKG